MRDIIRRTGLASGTFHNDVCSKEEIAQALAADAAQRLRPILRAERDRAVALEAWLDGATRAYFRFLVEEYGSVAGLPHVRLGATPAQCAVFGEVRESLTRVLSDSLAPQADTAYLAAGAIGIARHVGEQMLQRAPPNPDGAARPVGRRVTPGCGPAAP